MPTIFPSASPLSENKIAANSTYLCGDYGNESATVQLRGQAIFAIQASFQTNCENYAAYWEIIRSNRQILEVDFRQIEPRDEVCMKCLGMDHVLATLDLSMMSSLFNLEKIVIKHEGKIVSEKYFQGAFCGGIAAFPCPIGYECKLDGAYPDAGGKCILSYGFLKGNVSIGPFCPVERPGVACPIPPEAYSSRKLLATGPLPLEKARIMGIGENGHYEADLAPGMYTISLQQDSTVGGSNLPATVTIYSAKTTILDVDIDTGIR
jgi:hypothetical protein